MADESLSFLARLKQHHLYGVVVAYAVVVGFLIQLVSRAFPYFGWAGAVPAMIIVLLLGFPVVVVLAWLFIKPKDPAKSDTWQRRHWKLSAAVTAVVIVLVVISGFYAVRFSERRADRLALSAATSSLGESKSTNAVGPLAVPVISAKSIAVLPFENLSSDKDNAYFAAGMQDMILTKLADIGVLKVISRTSTMQYGSHPQNLKSIALQLGVAAILEGSVQRAGNQVLINVQLIDAATDQHLWAEAYTRTLGNIFGVEGEVAAKVAVALNAKLTSAESMRVASVPTKNVDAYDLFLQGEYYYNRAEQNLLKSDFETAILNYRKAIWQDPKFALAWAKLSITQINLLAQYGDDGTGLASQAKTASERALALEPNLAEAHLAQGWYRDYILHDLDGALVSFKTALATKPQDSQTLFAIGVIYQHRGLWDPSIEAFQHASALDPKSSTILNHMAVSYIFLRHYAEATQLFRQALAIDPSSALDVFELMNMNFLVGNLDGAAAVFDATPENARDNPLVTEAHAGLLLYRRDYAAARKLYASMKPAASFSAQDIEAAQGDLEWAAGDRPLARKYYLRAKLPVEAQVAQDMSSAYLHDALGWIYARLGRDREALEQGEIAVKLSPMDKNFIAGTTAIFKLSQIQAQVGQVDEAVANLDHLLAIPAGGYVSVPVLKLDPVWDSIRKDPRFQALLMKYSNVTPALVSHSGG